MNIYLIIILAILVGEYFLDLITENLNLRCIKTALPEEFSGYYDKERYRKSQEYLKERTKFGLIKDAVFTSIIIVFIISGGFNLVDKFARSFQLGYIFTGLVFSGVLMLASQALEIPFSAYHTFVIEEKYGFNKTTLKTFISDRIKTLVIGAVIGGTIFIAIIWFFKNAGKIAWLYCWVGVTGFQIFLTFISPVIIMPLFNKFTPLEEGELKRAIEGYAETEKFKMKGVFKIDASRRSAKSNAFFAGFGKYRRVGLFDTLIEKHTKEEIVSVLAHEIGHYKKKHIIKQLAISVFATGLAFFILSFFMNNIGLFKAFGMERTSIYASIFFFAFLYSPINVVFSVFTNFLSRRHEYAADEFAVFTYRKQSAFVAALKKLSVDNLSNLSPHPLKVFLHYSHPPVLKRIEAIKTYEKIG